MGWTVRTAVAADAEQVATLRVRSWQHAYRGILPDETLDAMRPETAVPHWTQVIAEPSPTRVFVAVDADDRPLSFCLVGDARQDTDRHHDLRTAELWAIYADPEALGTGAGHGVHEAAMAHLAHCGFGHAVVWVLEDNEIGLGFYRSHGWQPDGGRTQITLGGSTVPEVRYARAV